MKKVISFAAVSFFIAAILAAVFARAQNGDFQKPGDSGGQSNRAAKVITPLPAPVFIPRIVVRQDRTPINLRDLAIDIEVVGNIALTTYDMTFHNPNSATLEGEFVMPLGENQNVSAIALDINGKMRNGVVVEKQKARQTFEAIVRRGADPALVEKTAGNQFKMRIYPFNPNGTRRLSVTIEEPLKTQNDRYIYSLPLLFNQKINFSIKAEIPLEGASETPVTDTDLSRFSFSRVSKVFKASFSEKDYLLNNKIAFAIPKQKEEAVFTHKEGDKTFFYADVNVRTASKGKTAPKKIVIIWDSSLSSSKRDIKRELSLLGAYFNRFPDIDVSFITFNIKTDINKNFSVKNGNWDALKKEIESLVYDGATRFDRLNLNDLKADEILLFSDGISTLGNTRIGKSNIPVFVINSSPEFERGALTAAARRSCGSFINLTGVPDKDALAMLTGRNLRLVSYSFNKSRFKEVFPEEGADVSENFTFAGILTASEGEITLSFGYGKGDITETKKITIKSSGDNPAVSRLWAQQKIRELELDSEKNEAEILKLGKEYSVVTEFTSLLVLEELRDYLTYKITPPQELLSEYNKALSNMRKEEEEEKKEALEEAIELAEEIKEWWKKDFNHSKPPKEFQKLHSGSAVTSSGAATTSASASLGGRVMDTAQAVLPGADVTAINVETNVETKTTTNNAGAYNFANLQPGTYRIVAQIAGFTTKTVTDVRLRMGVPANLNIELYPKGSVIEINATASAESMVLEASPSTGTVRQEASATQLPTLTGDVLDSISFLGGVQANDINVSRDGISANEIRYNSSATSPSPVDAGMGRGAGQVQVVSRHSTSMETTVSVEIKEWDPQTPYMKILKKSQDGELYKDYLKLKDGYEDQPSFYFDVTDEFVNRGQKDKAVVVLSNIVEMKLDSVELLLTAANKLMELGEYQYAVDVFEKILKLRGEDPQSYRNLALAYQAAGKNQKSLEMFYKILTGTWERFEDIKQIVFVEMNNLISLNPGMNLSDINKKLIFAMPVNVRIVLGWSTDDTDIDIHVRDPYGETAFYENRQTRIGGRVSEDITDGFGPEEFMLKNAVDGDYEIWTNNYGDSRQSISGPTTLYLDIYTFYGTKNQTHKRVLVRTENVKENNVIGTVNFKKK